MSYIQLSREDSKVRLERCVIENSGQLQVTFSEYIPLTLKDNFPHEINRFEFIVPKGNLEPFSDPILAPYKAAALKIWELVDYLKFKLEGVAPEPEPQAAAPEEVQPETEETTPESEPEPTTEP